MYFEPIWVEFGHYFIGFEMEEEVFGFSFSFGIVFGLKGGILVKKGEPVFVN